MNNLGMRKKRYRRTRRRRRRRGGRRRRRRSRRRRTRRRRRRKKRGGWNCPVCGHTNSGDAVKCQGEDPDGGLCGRWAPTPPIVDAVPVEPVDEIMRELEREIAAAPLSTQQPTKTKQTTKTKQKQRGGRRKTRRRRRRRRKQRGGFDPIPKFRYKPKVFLNASAPKEAPIPPKPWW